MEIFEVENNIVKITYEPSDNIVLSGFVIITDENSQPFIGQVLNLEAQNDKNIATVKLIFNFTDDGVITNYNGSSPSFEAEIVRVGAEDLLGLFPINTPIEFGDLIQQNIKFKMDVSFFKNRPLALIDTLEMQQRFVMNLKNQLANSGKKTIIFDFVDNFNYGGKKLVAGKDFKLPLNYETINFIYENGLENANPETKALIQEIFLELQNYVKTVPDKFIPFDTFKSVVDDQYYQLQLAEMVLLKNKLLKFSDDGIFATQKSEFEILNQVLNDENIIVINLANIDFDLQREFISYTYKIMESLGIEIYSLLKISDDNSDKKLLKQIYSTKSVQSAVICEYDYKFAKELKKLSKDKFLFSPLEQQKDFPSYASFLNILNEGEFVVWGKSTHNIPFIVATRHAAEVKDDEMFLPKENIQTETQNVEEIEQETGIEQNEIIPETTNEQIKRDVDEIIPPSIYDKSFVENEEIPEEETKNLPVEVENILPTPLDIQLEQPEFSNEYKVTEEDLEVLDELDGVENIEEQEIQPIENQETEIPQEEILPNITDEDFVDMFSEEISQETPEIPEIEENQNQDEVFEENIEDFSNEEEIEENLENNNDEIFDEEFISETDEEEINETEDDEIEAEQVEEPEIIENIDIEKTEETSEFDDILTPDNKELSNEVITQNDADTIIDKKYTDIPVVPVYEAEIERTSNSDDIKQGDIVRHAKYGRGIVKNMINYGTKTICSIQFDNVGRKLLDPTLSEIKKIEE